MSIKTVFALILMEFTFHVRSFFFIYQMLIFTARTFFHYVWSSNSHWFTEFWNMKKNYFVTMKVTLNASVVWNLAEVPCFFLDNTIITHHCSGCIDELLMLILWQHRYASLKILQNFKIYLLVLHTKGKLRRTCTEIKAEKIVIR